MVTEARVEQPMRNVSGEQSANQSPEQVTELDLIGIVT